MEWSDSCLSRAPCSYRHPRTRESSGCETNAWSIRKPFFPVLPLFHENQVKSLLLPFTWRQASRSTQPSSMNSSEQLNGTPSRSHLESPVLRSPRSTNLRWRRSPAARRRLVQNDFLTSPIGPYTAATVTSTFGSATSIQRFRKAGLEKGASYTRNGNRLNRAIRFPA